MTDTIATPSTGLFTNVPPEQYHRWPEVSPSTAFPALESAKAYKCASETEREATDDMDLGTACHTAMFEPDEMLTRCVLWTGDRRYGKTWDQFCAANEGKLILTRGQHAVLLKVRDQLQSMPAVRRILAENGKREISMKWTRETESGPLACRSRADYVGRRLYDLKTSYRITDRAIVNTILSFGYDMSMAARREGWHANTGEQLDCVLIFAQTRPPFDARIVTIEGPELARGLKLWRRATDLIAACRQSGNWPGISEEETPLVMPEWALNEAGGNLNLSLDGAAVEM